MSEDIVRRTFTLTNNTTWCKFTVALVDTANPGQIIPATGSNQGPVAGVAQSSVLATGQSDYIAGQYQASLTGAAWPTGYPGSGTGRAVNTLVTGFSKLIKGATGTIAAGDRLAVADATGRVASIEADGLNLAAGTVAHVIGRAEEAATNTGDVFKAFISYQETKL